MILLSENALEDLLKLNNKKEKIFKDATLVIRGNIILFSGHFIQISNITQIRKGNIPKDPFPLAFLLISCILIYLAFIFSFYGIGIVVLLFDLGRIYTFFKQVQYYGLSIELNSGNSYFFTSADKSFVGKVFDVLLNIIEDNNSEANYMMNFGNGVIVNKSEKVSLKQKGEDNEYN